MGKSNILKRADIIIIAAVLLAALPGLVYLAWPPSAGTEELFAEIYLDGQLLQSITLAEGEQEIRMHMEDPVGYNVLQVSPRGIVMLEADCHNQDCLHTGWQTRPGAMIACLPHRLLIRLTGPKDGEFDAVTR